MSGKFHLCTSTASDPRYCFVSSLASPLVFALGDGDPALPVLAELDADALSLDIDEERGGLALPDLVGNFINCLIVRSSCVTAIRDNFDLGPHELVPVELVNSKSRVHSSDYVIINPLGQIDCLDLVRSEMDGDVEHPAVALSGTIFLRDAAIPPGRDLFRVRGIVYGYVFSARLVEFIQAQKFTNFEFEEIAP